MMDVLSVRPIQQVVPGWWLLWGVFLLAVFAHLTWSHTMCVTCGPLTATGIRSWLGRRLHSDTLMLPLVHWLMYNLL